MKEMLENERCIRLAAGLGPPSKVIIQRFKEASEVFIDMGYLKPQQQCYEEVAESLTYPLFQVETNVVLPADTCSYKENFVACAIRPKFWKHVYRFLKSVKKVVLENTFMDIDIPRYESKAY